MPGKLPYQKWFWGDWFKDTRCLSAIGRGVWIDTIGYLRESTPKGEATFTVEQWAKVLTVSISEMEIALAELENFHISDVARKSDGSVTLSCRRVKREKKARKSATIRQQAHRGDNPRDASVTATSQVGDGDSHSHSHIQRQSQKQSHSQKQKHSSDEDEEGKRKKKISAAPSARAAVKGASVPVWEAYAGAYRQRYGVDPVRNAAVNSALTHLVKRVGADDAPALAAWYVSHNGALYVQARHPTTLLLRDAEGLMTQMRTGQRSTRQEAQQAESVDAAREQVARVARLLNTGGT